MRPEGLLTAPAGDVYIVDQGGDDVREVDTLGIINTVYGTLGGDLKYGGNSSIGEPDTETVFYNVGPADGIYYIAMDPYGNTVAASSSGDTITSAGAVGQYVFPQQQIYSTSNPYYVFVSNPSGVALTFTGTPAITGPFAIDGGTCDLSGTLAAGADCTIGITFTPTADQLYTGSIVLTSNSNSSPSSINLSGTGIGFVTPSATLLPNPLPSFTSPSDVTSAAETATLTNTGVIPIAIGGTQFFGTSAVYFALASPTSTDCPATLGVGDSCHFYLTFTPKAATTYTAGFGVDITTDSYGYLNIGLNGTGTASLTAQAILFTQPTSPVTYTSGLTVPLVATGGASGNLVVFTLDGSSTGTGSISGSTLTVTGVGKLVINANQAGNATYSAAPPVQRTVVVNQAPQAINFTQLTSPVVYSSGLTIPLSATGGASGNPVLFTIDGSSTGTGTISGSTLTITSIGNLVIDANQAGNSSYSAAPQVQRTVVVDALTAQTINFTQPTSPVVYSSGLTIPLVATGGASGNPVLFTIDASSTGTGSISSSTLTVTGVGNLVIDANQAGNATYSAAPQVQRTVVVNQAPQAILFTQPTSPVVYSSGLTIPLSATGGASGNPVLFTIDGSSTGTGSISGSTLTVTGVGNLVIDANQAGNADYSAATQVQKTTVVDAPPPDFSIAATPPTQTVQRGGSASYTVTVAANSGNFSNAVTLTASGLPTGATANFTPSAVTPGSGSQNSTMTILTPALAMASPSGGGLGWTISVPTLALIFLLPYRRWRKVWAGKLLLLVICLVSLGAAVTCTGCGGGFGVNQSQTYTLTVTGTSGSDTHSTTVQLTVQ